eukprot:Opistho-2@10751
MGMTDALSPLDAGRAVGAAAGGDDRDGTERTEHRRGVTAAQEAQRSAAQRRCSACNGGGGTDVRERRYGHGACALRRAQEQGGSAVERPPGRRVRRAGQVQGPDGTPRCRVHVMDLKRFEAAAAAAATSDKAGNAAVAAACDMFTIPASADAPDRTGGRG